MQTKNKKTCRSIRDDELEHVKTMFSCERGKGALTSPNAAAATPRWDEDATTAEHGFVDDDITASISNSNRVKRNSGSGSLRTDVARKTPLERFTATFDPLRKLVNAVEDSKNNKQAHHQSDGAVVGDSDKKSQPPVVVLGGVRGRDDEQEEDGQEHQEGAERHGGVAATEAIAGGGRGKALGVPPSSSDSGENQTENRAEESV